MLYKQAEPPKYGSVPVIRILNLMNTSKNFRLRPDCTIFRLYLTPQNLSHTYSGLAQMSSALSALQLTRLFPMLDATARQVLAENGVLKTFAAGAALIDAGQYFRSTMLIISGQVKVYRPDEEGNEHLLYFLEAGDACALSMICAVKNEKSQLQGVAQTEVTLLMLPLSQMDKLMTENRSWYEYVLSSYRDRFEELLQVVDQIAFRALDERLLFYLSKLKKSTGGNRLHITHENIARDLSSSRVVISRLLKQLENRGMVKLHRNEIELLKNELM
jgi:CRP/FNR family transcriptional regulator, anaerobic regulatory protein